MNALARRAHRPAIGRTIVLHVGVPLAAPGDTRLSRETHLYFAYGADLCEPLLRRRCPDIHALGRASLHGFSLAFAGQSRTWGGATLTLVPTARAHVDGVLYVVSRLSLGDLDRMQGCPRVYERVTVAVADEGGAHEEAHAYCMRPPLGGGAPSDAYFDLVAREYHRLGIDPEPLVVALDRATCGAPLARPR